MRTAHEVQPVPHEVVTLAERYQVHELLGRGGMACVYRVSDLVSQREVALKQLTAPREKTERGRLTALFEREFQTLVQLRHPQVIEVYDYGLLPDKTPYYTMELLDGGDLRERAPLDWQHACRLLFDVCSSLALLHSRRLLHRDVSPRNVRCTRSGGAKLIDFGAMAPMSAGGADVVGTPAFVAPEIVQRLALDARADLFSLGATLYYALTGQLPFQARTFSEAQVAWSHRIAAPSSLAPEVPAALDDLVLGLLSIEPSLRPPSAFEVMQRLAAIADLKSSEDEAVSRAYLATPSLIGRESELDAFRKQLLTYRMSRGRASLISGAPGVGRSRLVDACALEAKTLGFTVLRATASSTSAPFATARDLTEHLREALRSHELYAAASELWVAAPGAETSEPLQLKTFDASGPGAEQLQRALCGLWLSVSEKHPLVIAVDDVNRIDAASASVLLAFLDGAAQRAVRLVLSADSSAPASDALRALARRCEVVKLEPLSREQVLQLLGSLFGEVANLDMLAREIYAVTAGNPRQCMDTAQHLVERGLVRYAVGTWTIASRLSAADLPRTGDAAMRARLSALSPQARFIAEAQALALSDAWTDSDYGELLPDVSSSQLERALSELLEAQVLVADRATYRLGTRLWSTVLVAELEPRQLELRHRALAALYRDKVSIAFIHHTFASGQDEEGLAALQKMNADHAKNIDSQQVLADNISKMFECYPRALETAQRIGVSARELSDLRRWHFAGSTTVEYASYPDSARLLLAQLEHDSGLDLYRADPDTTDPMQRLMRALTGAQERFLATPERDRVYSVEEAIKQLAEYVVFGIVIGGRSQDAALLHSLPPLLEPFATLSPVLDAIWRNGVATCVSQSKGRFEVAYKLWLDVLSRLDAASGSEMPFIREISTAVAFAVGMMEAQFGLASVSTWAARIEQDAYHRVSALQLRRIVHLDRGDLRGAERLRRQAELISLQSPGPQMFKTLINVELASCMRASDLVGVQEVLERMRPLATAYPGWIPNLQYAEGAFHLVRGDYAAAKVKFEESVALAEFDEHGASRNSMAWICAVSGLSEALLGLDRAEDARANASRALDVWQPDDAVIEAVDLVRVLALAEGKLGIAGAAERLEDTLASQIRAGVTGLRIGLSYEARAQIAIWQHDAEAFERYAELTACEYRYGADSGLGARYDRLVNEASRYGLRAGVTPADFATDASESALTNSVKSVVSRSLSGIARHDDRARKALQLLCEFRKTDTGHLYLPSPVGLVLCASQGEHAQPADPSALSRFLDQAQAHSHAMDHMATEEPVDDTLANTMLAGTGCSYELLLLSSVVADTWQVAAVAAVAHNGASFEPLRQRQLLSALAEHLLEDSERASSARHRRRNDPA
jgi:serine/threonine protein kinase/ABC-type transporter Mla MlaB component